MLQLNDKTLPEDTNALLQEYQKEVDSKPDFTGRVAEAKRLFKNHNTQSNPAFKVVRRFLANISGDTIRCNYCEDSNANQIEHIYPKHFYPERCFEWLNYCYSCGPCNQPKHNKFSIYEAESQQELNLKELPEGTGPPPGEALLINPRVEDPMHLLFLDTKDTFKFTPNTDDDKEKRRAFYTIELLGLNSRNHLVRARKVAFDNYKSRLFEYVAKKDAGAEVKDLSPLIDSFCSEHHKTVWQEMIRQRSLHPEVDDLLKRAPEALNWN